MGRWVAAISVCAVMCGCFASTGPVIGLAPGHGPKLGWEVSGGIPFSPLIATAGFGAERTPRVRAPDAELDEVPPTSSEEWAAMPFLAWDPMLVAAGGRVGVGYSTVSGFAMVGGARLDGPVYGGVWGNGPATRARCGQNDRTPLNLVVSLALRVNWWAPFNRSSDTLWDLDVAPKVGRERLDLGGGLL
jgi:hypothetical protein